ncbi:MAG: hypothetical protein PHU12_03935 [Candidatus Aenigmarchaeota archaeon]|nr:hypothetical protein [Candidatus Aenigmarchaeota archaeon]
MPRLLCPSCGEELEAVNYRTEITQWGTEVGAAGLEINQYGEVEETELEENEININDDERDRINFLCQHCGEEIDLDNIIIEEENGERTTSHDRRLRRWAIEQGETPPPPSEIRRRGSNDLETFTPNIRPVELNGGFMRIEENQVLNNKIEEANGRPPMRYSRSYGVICDCGNSIAVKEEQIIASPQGLFTDKICPICGAHLIKKELINF